MFAALRNLISCRGKVLPIIGEPLERNSAQEVRIEWPMGERMI